MRYTTQERSPLVETATDLQADQEALKAAILDLRVADPGGRAGGGGLGGPRQRPQRRARRPRGSRPASSRSPAPASSSSSRTRSSPADPDGNTEDLLVGARDLRTIVEELWAAGAEAVAVNGERMTPTTAVIDIGPSILVNSAYLAGPYQVTAIGPDDLYARLSASPGFVDFIRARAEAWGLRVSFAEPETVDMPAFAGHGHPALRPAPAVARRATSSRAADDAPAPQPAHHRGRGLRPRPARRRPAADPGERRGLRRAVVAGPDGARRQPQRPQRRAARRDRDPRARAVDADRQHRARRGVGRRAARRPAPRPAVRRASIRRPGPAWSSRSAARSTGPASRTSSTSCATPAPRRSRSTPSGWCPGVVTVGAAGAVTVDAVPMSDPFELPAIGAPDKLTGSLTRSGGIIAQLAATQPDVVVEVTPLDRVDVPATDRDLVPSHGHPRL